MLDCQSRSVCLRRCLCLKCVLYISCKISRFRKVLLEILTDMESVWNTKDGDMKCVRGLCGKLGWKRLFFRFTGNAYDVLFLFCRYVMRCNVIFSLKKVSNLSDFAFLSIAVKNFVSLSPHHFNSWLFWRTSHPIVSVAGESAANFTLVWLLLFCFGMVTVRYGLVWLLLFGSTLTMATSLLFFFL